MIPDTKDAKNVFFRFLDVNTKVTISVCLAVLYPHRCYPAEIWRTISDPRACEELLLEARESDALKGDLSTMATAMLQRQLDNPEHYESGRTGASNALSAFKKSSSFGCVGVDDDFGIETLRDESLPPAIVFDIARADQLSVFGKAHSLVLTSRMQTLRRHPKGREIIVLADEATNAPIPTVVSDLELLRSFKVRLCLFYQSASSLKRVYGEEGAASIRANCVEVNFGVSDLATSEEISKRIGDHTVATSSYSFDQNGKPSRSIGQSAKRLFPPEDILAMPKGKMLVLVPNMRPALLDQLPWYEVEPYKHLASGNNPHEQHPPSPVTRIKLTYGSGADDLRAPDVPDIKQRIRCAMLTGDVRHHARVPFLTRKSFRWVPFVAAIALGIAVFGTPHVIFRYQVEPNSRGESACVYFGLDGFQETRVRGRCPKIKFLKSNQETSS
ncbi:MAG: type IV secretory system conjugative DNA transfer family protein [Henriciella sp.]|nr:type IV secretory system conjugative DNA transfer family protein [Henriciella sp.]